MTTILKNTIVPIVDPDRRRTTWHMEDIYTGGSSGNGRYVPNVGDTVLDKTSGSIRWYEVAFVDESTLLSDLVEIKTIAEGGINNENALLGIGPGYQSETWRLFLDTSIVPHVFIPDSRLNIYGSSATKYKVFLGTNTSKDTGRVISMDFNNNGDLISDDLPLEKVAFKSGAETDTNKAVKCCRKGYTTEKLQNGEVVTLVTYNDIGEPTSYSKLLVHNTALDRNVESSKKYIATIGIESPFLDKTENNTLIFPSNIPRDALAIMGVITYSDGSQVRLPIDGNRMRLYGLDDYVSMKPNQYINLVLTYHMTANEMALNASVGSDRFVSVKYFGRTQQVDGSYSAMLFPIPTYLSDTGGWKLRYLLYTLDRDMVYDVTNYVVMGSTSNPFNPLDYGTTQSLTVALELNDVDARLKKFRHVQSFKIALMSKPSVDNQTPFYLTYEKDQDPLYGANIVCKGINDPGLGKWTLDITCGAKTMNDWLDRVYYATKPLCDNVTELKAPKPTHFTIFIDDTAKTYPIRAWNTKIVFPKGAHDGYGVVITWTRVDGANEYQLGASPMAFLNISKNGTISHAGTTTIKVDSTTGSANASTLIDVDAEVQKIIDRGATQAVVDKYRELLERIKQFGLLKYEAINRIYQRIRTDDITPAMIANDVILLEMEINKVSTAQFTRDTRITGNAVSMEQ